MKMLYQKYGYPAADEGLEKDKPWYSFQLIEKWEKEITEQDFNNYIITLVCEKNCSIEYMEKVAMIEDGNAEYIFYFD